MRCGESSAVGALLKRRFPALVSVSVSESCLRQRQRAPDSLYVVATDVVLAIA
ncbi:MAG: hypothetical protein KME50_14135 [Nostoc desertorum CM1-VF14]|nr:hypothetical protein [Nostoc desertorum CM1-VF14]